MARNENVTIPQNTWTQLTNADATAVRVQNIGGLTLYLRGTADSTAPTNDSGAILLRPMETITADVTLESLFPSGGASRLWAWCGGPGTVSVSHADA